MSGLHNTNIWQTFVDVEIGVFHRAGREFLYSYKWEPLWHSFQSLSRKPIMVNMLKELAGLEEGDRLVAKKHLNDRTLREIYQEFADKAALLLF